VVEPSGVLPCRAVILSLGLGRGLGLIGYIGTAIAAVSFSAISFLKVIVRQ
jgi:hypothetical protein